MTMPDELKPTQDVPEDVTGPEAANAAPPTVETPHPRLPVKYLNDDPDSPTHYIVMGIQGPKQPRE